LVARSKYFIFRKIIISTIPQKYTEMMGEGVSHLETLT
jgi:hypothetical protein